MGNSPGASVAGDQFSPAESRVGDDLHKGAALAERSKPAR